LGASDGWGTGSERGANPLEIRETLCKLLNLWPAPPKRGGLQNLLKRATEPVAEGRTNRRTVTQRDDIKGAA